MRCVLSIILKIVVLTFSCAFKFVWWSVWLCLLCWHFYLLVVSSIHDQQLVYTIVIFIENLHWYVVHVFYKIRSLKEVVRTLNQVTIEEFLRLIGSIQQHDHFWCPCWRSQHHPNCLVHDIWIWEARRRRVGLDLTPVSPCSICWRWILDLPTLV